MLDHHHHHHDECDHEHEAQAEILDHQRDPAAKSLSDALRLSFRLLTVLMVFILGLFLFAGVKQVPSGSMGVKSVLGKVVGVTGEGLQYTWPFPVGQIAVIPVRQQTLNVQDFWMFETAEEKSLDLSKRTTQDPGLRPGIDGALLTGDAYLIHMELSCGYRVTDVLAFMRNVRLGSSDANLFIEADKAVRSAIDAAAIRAAAMRTAERLMSGQEQDKFRNDVQAEAQKILNERDAGITLSVPNVLRSTWPVRALPEYAAAQRAGQQAEAERDKARREASDALIGVCGPNYAKFVGEPWRDLSTQHGEANAEMDLIGKYETARREDDANAADAILRRIDEILVSQATTGEVSKLVAAADGYKSKVNLDVQARVKRFEQLLPEYLNNPQFLMAREWTQTRQEILQSPSVVKWMWSFSKTQKTIVEINTPPEIAKDMRNQMLAAQKADANNPANKK